MLANVCRFHGVLLLNYLFFYNLNSLNCIAMYTMITSTCKVVEQLELVSLIVGRGSCGIFSQWNCQWSFELNWSLDDTVCTFLIFFRHYKNPLWICHRNPSKNRYFPPSLGRVQFAGVEISFTWRLFAWDTGPGPTIAHVKVFLLSRNYN